MAVRKKRVASRKTVKMGGRKGNRVAASPGKVAFGKSTLATTKGSGIRGVKKKTVNVSTVKTSLRATVTPKTGAKGRKTVAPKGKLQLLSRRLVSLRLRPQRVRALFLRLRLAK
jgi:hypothetical protein